MTMFNVPPASRFGFPNWGGVLHQETLPGLDLGFGPASHTLCSVTSDSPNMGGGRTWANGVTEQQRAVSYPPVQATQELLTPLAQSLSSQHDGATVLTVGIMKDPNATTPVGYMLVVGDAGSQINIADIQADITVVPQVKKADTQAVLGISQAWLAQANRAENEGQTDKATEIRDAIQSYDKEQRAQFNQEFFSGQVVVATTRGQHAGVPRIFLHTASVPDEDLYKTNAAEQEDRIRHLENVIQRLLHTMQNAVQNTYGQQPIKEKPLTVSMPFLCTGPWGAVSHQECAAVLYRVVGKFVQEHPGYQFVFPVYDRYTSDDQFTGYVHEVHGVMKGDRAFLENLRIPTPDNAQTLFERLAHTHLTPSSTGVRITKTYLNDKFDEWLTKVTERATAVDDTVFNARCMGRDKFGSLAERDCFNQIHKMAQLPALDDPDSLQRVKAVTKSDFKKILSNPTLKEQVVALVMNKLHLLGVTKNFAGEKDIIQIIAAAMASVLEKQRIRALFEIEDVLQNRVRQQQSVTDSLIRQLQLSQDQVDSLTSRLDEESDKREQLRNELAEARKGEGQIDELKNKISALEAELRQLRSQLSTQTSYVNQYTSRTGTASTYRSVYHTGESQKGRGYRGE